jgi:hypothetical protein
MTPTLLSPQTSGEAAGRAIPFDYSFQFDLAGPGSGGKEMVDVSVEGAFTAVSIGYGVIPTVESIEFGPDLAELPSGTSLGDIPLSALMQSADSAFAGSPELARGRPASDAAFLQGIRLNPAVAHVALLRGSLPARVLSRLFCLAGSGSTEIQFLYALTDEGSGRSFQSEPILNTAGLGISNGERPFRYFVPPITFEPRSKISLQVTEVSNFVGQLHVVLQGYKVLGGAESPTGRVLSGRGHAPTQRRRR